MCSTALDVAHWLFQPMTHTKWQVGFCVPTAKVVYSADPSSDCNIRLDELPTSFVMKPTHLSGPIVKVKNSRITKCQFTKGLDFQLQPQGLCDGSTQDVLRNFCVQIVQRLYDQTFSEPTYLYMIPRVYAEELLYAQDGKELPDFKIFVFNGVVAFLQVFWGRFGSNAIQYYGLVAEGPERSLGWHLLNISNTRQGNRDFRKRPPPPCLPRLVEVASRLGCDIDFVRVDLYITNRSTECAEAVLLGEMTFVPAAGENTMNDGGILARDLALLLPSFGVRNDDLVPEAILDKNGSVIVDDPRRQSH